MDRYEHADKLAAECDLWAALDGCEGGELLRSLADVLRTCHYSYYNDESVYQRVVGLVHDELSGHWMMIWDGRYVEYHGQEDVDYTLKEINGLWND